MIAHSVYRCSMPLLLPIATSSTPKDGIDCAIQHGRSIMWAMRHDRAWLRCDPMDVVAAYGPWLSRACAGLPAAPGLGQLGGRTLSVEIGIRGWELNEHIIGITVTDAAENVPIRAGLSRAERETLILRLWDEARALSTAWTEAMLVREPPIIALHDSPGFRLARTAFTLSEARRSEFRDPCEPPLDAGPMVSTYRCR